MYNLRSRDKYNQYISYGRKFWYEAYNNVIRRPQDSYSTFHFLPSPRRSFNDYTQLTVSNCRYDITRKSLPRSIHFQIAKVQIKLKRNLVIIITFLSRVVPSRIE
jgi:hypothetical protein